MKKSFYIIACTSLLLITGTSYLRAQDNVANISNYFRAFTTYPQEKLYLHLDKPHYAAGENIFWKAYLTNSVHHTSTTKTNFIYVELIDAQDNVIERKKVRKEENSFRGSIRIDGDTPAGQYYLRAYTQWMLNADKAYFYTRQLRIGNELDRSILSSISYDESDKKDKYTVTVGFTDESGKPLPNITVIARLSEKDKKKADRYRERTNQQGEIYFDITADTPYKRRSLEVTFKDDLYNYSRTFQIPPLGAQQSEFALSFFPEGGDLLSGNTQRVGFKAQKSDGNSCHLQGLILTDKGDTVTTFRTEHDGMGVFTLAPVAGTQYMAHAWTDSTSLREFALPPVQEEGKQLTVLYRNGAIQYMVQKAAGTQWEDTLYLMAHTRGVLSAFFRLVPATDGSITGKFDDEPLGEGINELLLANKNGVVMSRRLIFKYPPQHAGISVSPYPDLTQPRRKVEIPLKITDKEGAPVQSSFSVSITDRNLVVPDSLSDNIYSYFLLTSDLKGYVENPGYYFLKPSSHTRHYMDLLMLTHGWSRFRHDNISQPPTIHLDYYMEAGQTISGKATRLLGGKAKKCPVILLSPSQNISVISETDEEGNFLFDNIQYKDTATFAAQARSKRGYATVFLKVDSTLLPAPENKYPVSAVSQEKKYRDYDITVRNSYLDQGGMRVIRLNEVVVTGNKKKAREYVSTYGGINDYVVVNDGSPRFQGSLEHVLRTIHGVRINMNELYLFNETTPPLVIVNGMRYTDGIDALQGLTGGDVKAIEVLRSTSANYLGSDARGGALVITLIDGADIKPKAPPGLLLFTSQGYSDSAEFYHPVYETPQQTANSRRDVRSTVYWNPNLKTDAEGNAVIGFYTPDNSISPHLEIEGVLENGELIRFVK